MTVNPIAHNEHTNRSNAFLQHKPAAPQRPTLFSTQLEANKSHTKLQHAADHSGLSTLAKYDNVDHWHTLMGQTYGYDQNDSSSEAYQQSDAIRQRVLNQDWDGLGIDVQQVTQGTLGGEAAFAGGDTAHARDDHILLNDKPGKVSHGALTEELFHAFERQINPGQEGDTRLVNGQASFTDNTKAAALDEGELGRTLLSQFKASGAVPMLSEDVLASGGIRADDRSWLVLNGQPRAVENTAIGDPDPIAPQPPTIPQLPEVPVLPADPAPGDGDGDGDGEPGTIAGDPILPPPIDLPIPEDPVLPADPAPGDGDGDGDGEPGTIGGGPILPPPIDPAPPVDPPPPADPKGTLEGGKYAWFASEAYVPPADVPDTWVLDGVTWTKVASSADAANAQDGDTWTLWKNDNDELIVANEGTAFGQDWGDVARDVESVGETPVGIAWGLPGEAEGTLNEDLLGDINKSVLYGLASVGKGFADRVNNQKDAIFAAIKAVDPEGTNAVKFVGHSLGASAAQGLGYVFSLANPDQEVSVEAYNAPKLGNAGMTKIYTDMKASGDYNFSSVTYNVSGDPVSLAGLPTIEQVDGDDVHWRDSVAGLGSLTNHDVANWQGAQEVALSGKATEDALEDAADEVFGQGLHIDDTAAKDEYLTAAKSASIEQLDAVLADPDPDWAGAVRNYDDKESIYQAIADDTDGNMIKWITELDAEKALSGGVQDLLGWAAQTGRITAAEFGDEEEDTFDVYTFLNDQDLDTLNKTGNNADFWSLAPAEYLLTLFDNKSASTLVQDALGGKMTSGKGAEILSAVEAIGYGTFFAGISEDERATMNPSFLATFSKAKAKEAGLSEATVKVINDANIRAVQAEAKKALLSINATSIEENREWGGAIWKDVTTGKFGFTGPGQGTLNGYDIDVAIREVEEMGANFSYLGDFHTHGDYSDLSGNRTDKEHDRWHSDTFSTLDLISSEEDIKLADEESRPATFTSYLGTPSGNFVSYNPKDKVDPDEQFAPPKVFSTPDLYAVA